MQNEKRISLPLEHYERAPSGMWVRSVRTSMSIRMEWQVRTHVESGRVRTIGVNGEVDRTDPLASARWEDAWRCAGELTLQDEFVLWSTPRMFDACAYGAQRHMAGLLAAGFGDEDDDDPGRIVEWFRDLHALRWMTEGAIYVVDRDVAPFVGMCGASGELAWNEDVPTLYLRIRDREFPIDLMGAELQRAFLCATVVRVSED